MLIITTLKMSIDNDSGKKKVMIITVIIIMRRKRTLNHKMNYNNYNNNSKAENTFIITNGCVNADDNDEDVPPRILLRYF